MEHVDSDRDLFELYSNLLAVVAATQTPWDDQPPLTEKAVQAAAGLIGPVFAKLEAAVYCSHILLVRAGLDPSKLPNAYEAPVSFDLDVASSADGLLTQMRALIDAAKDDVVRISALAFSDAD